MLPNPRNSSNLKTALKISEDLKNCDFIDANTRVVILEFALVNPSMLDVFTLAHFSVEFDVTGAVYPRSRIHQYRLFRSPQTIEKQKHISNDHPAVILHFVFWVMTVYNLMIEFDQFFTSVYNQEYVHVWPRIYFPGFVARNETVKFISLSDYLRESLHPSDRKLTKAIPVSYVLLQQSQNFFRGYSRSRPRIDQYSIAMENSRRIGQSAAISCDTYQTFMQRLSINFQMIIH